MVNLINEAVLTGYGIIEKSSSGNVYEIDELSPTGYFIRTDDISFVIKTIEIPAKLDTATHPELINPNNGKVFSETTEYKSNYTDEENFDFYEFEAEWEIKAGKWSFQIIENDRILLEHQFEVSTRL